MHPTPGCHPAAAGTTVTLVPIIVFFAALRRYVMRGLAQGGIKG